MDIQFLEFHDSRLQELVLFSGTLHLRFAHLSVYEERGDDLYDVVSYRAEVLVTGVSELRCTGVINQADMVSTVQVDAVEISSTAETALLGDGRKAQSVEIAFVGGASIYAKCQNISVKLGERGRILEVWEGPL